MKTDGQTRLLGLIGKPVRHTLSPVIHGRLSELYGYNEVYVPFEVDGEGLGDAVRGAHALGVLGLNVTVPHKNNVMEFLADIDEGAAAIGAVNTLVRGDGGYKGYNTDEMGLARELSSYGIGLAGERVVILGAGGAARAVAYMCAVGGAEQVFILNRTLHKAAEIADDMNGHFGRNIMKPMELSDYKTLRADGVGDGFVVFQATSIGLAPNVDAAVIDDEEFYKLVKVGVDLIYNPFETKFMKLCREAGARAYNGLRMLLYQGVAAYELWNGISVSEAMCDKVYDSLLKAARRNVILVGFMGCGKTTVGQALASELGYEFVDVDEYIERSEKREIKDIFADEGEEYFRELETRAVDELNAVCSHCVISTGGGLPMRDVNVSGLRRLGSIFYLRVTPDEVIRRLAGDTTRPLLQADDVVARVSSLMEQREQRYADAADYALDVTGMPVADIVRDIMRLCGLRT